MERSLSCIIDADIHAIPRVSTALDEAMRAHAFSDEEILDTQLAVEEAVTNVIVHGYAGTTGQIAITCRTTGELAEVRIEDTSPAFDPLSIPEPDITKDIDDRKIGGLGIFLIRQVMDDIIYRYEDGKNILVLVKKKKA
jgi:serine/threonine-protein kinase RsbW